MNDAAAAGRFSDANRNIAEEEEIVLISVGVDIGSSTSHLVFSRVTMERFGARYIVSKRETLHQAPITLTPYLEGEDIDAEALGARYPEAWRRFSPALAWGAETGLTERDGTTLRLTRRGRRLANELFVRCTAAERDALRGQGFGFYDWGDDAARFVTAWNTRAEDASALAKAIASL